MRVHLLIGLLLLVTSSWARAESEIEEIERIFKDEAPAQSDSEREARPSMAPVLPTPSLKSVQALEPFQNFVAIQRKYLPRSQRFELHASLGAMVNDPFFNNFAGQGRVGYNFTEAWGIEALGVYATGAERDVTRDLRNRRGVNTNDLLTPNYVYGGLVRWSPFYGKMALLNRSVIPFDHYFTLGGGVTGTNQNTTPFTYMVGTGQAYALSHNMAVRWDLLWLIYNTESRSGGPSQFGRYNNIFLTVGLSFHLPEAGYR